MITSRDKLMPKKTNFIYVDLNISRHSK